MGGDGRTLYVLLSANAAAYRAAMRGAGDDTRRFGQDVDDVGRKVDSTGKEIDKLSGRLRIALDLLALIGPAAVPIAGVAVPAVTALAAQVGVLSIAAGAAMLASRGMADALKAVEKARLDPTAENLAEMHRTLSELAPAAREFVGALQETRDEVDALSDAAAAGLFPGLTEALEDFRTLTPELTRMAYEYAGALGDAAEQGADAFTSDRGREFLAFLTSEARPTLSSFMQMVGNLAGGMGALWQAFDPLNDDAADYMLDRARAFDEWAQRLDDTEGYQDFMRYLRETGPQVEDALGAIVNMTVQIVQAAAPLGGPVLAGIEAFADAVAAVADSDLGTPLFTAAAAATLLNRSLQLTGALMTRAGLGAATGGVAGTRAGVFGAITAGSAAASGGIRTLTSDLRAMSQEYRRSAQTTTRVAPSLFSAAPLGQGRDVTTGAGQRRVGAVGSTITSMLSGTTAAAQRTASTLGSVTRAAGGAGAAVGAMAVLTTEAGQSMGLTNTAMLGMVGTMAGPLGAALGVGVGALLDWRAAAGEAREAAEEFDAAVEGQFTSLTAYATAADQYRSRASAYADQVTGESLLGQLATSLTPGGVQNNLDVLFGGVESSKMGRMAAEADDARMAVEDLELAGRELAVMLGTVESGTARSAITTEQLDEALRAAQPAMSALGLSTDDLIQGVRDGSIVQMLDQIEQWQSNADSAAGRTDAFARSVADLGNDALATADSAQVMGTALEALLSPALNAEAATDAWRQSLQKLREELDATAGFQGNGAAAMENRDLTRTYVEDSMKRLEALAGVATTTEEDMARAVSQTREEFIKSGMAAGFSREEITRRARALGLTPKLVRTTFEAVGVTEAELKARELRAGYRALPKAVRTRLQADGVPKSEADVRELQRRYDLTPKQVRTLVALQKEAAQSGITNVQQLLDRLGRTVARPSVQVAAQNALGVISSIGSALSGLNGRTATTYVNTVRTTTRGGMGPVENADGALYVAGRRFADGGWGMDGRYYQREPQIVAGGANILWGEQETGWEAYISGKPSQRSRNVAILQAAAGRFGLRVSDRHGSEHVGRAQAPAVVVQQALPDKVVLEVDGQQMTAYVRGHARDVAGRTVREAGNAAGATERMNW